MFLIKLIGKILLLPVVLLLAILRLLVKIGMEVFLVLITAGTGVIEGVLQMASESLGGFMRS